MSLSQFMNSNSSVRPSQFTIWVTAMRPQTLPAAAVPVIIGTSMAYGDRVHHLFSALIALVAALLIQIGTNFVNDYSDFKKGSDTTERIGPIRVTQAGWVSPKQMLIAVRIVFSLAIAVSVYLVIRGGIPILIIGILSMISGILYTAGPKPYGYMGLGDLFVLIFFGPVAVAGTYYVQSLTFSFITVIAGLAPGLISVAILTVNNLRDYEQDLKSGKKTLAVRYGKKFAIYQYVVCIMTACIVIPYLPIFLTFKHLYTVFAFASSIPALIVVNTIITREDDGPSLNQALASTGKVLIIYGLLFSGGWIISSSLNT